MVELKRCGTTVIAAQHAPATCLGHEDRLLPTPPIGDRIHAAPPTSGPTAVLDDEQAISVESTVTRYRPLAFRYRSLDNFARNGGASASSAGRSQPKLLEPVADRRHAPIQLVGHLLEGGAALHERLEILTSQAAAWRVFLLTVGRQAVLLDPLADRRRIAICQRSDLRKRQSRL
jgi:hypothetical protein